MIINEIDCYSNKATSEIECKNDCIKHRVLKVTLKHTDAYTQKLFSIIKDKVAKANFNTASSSGSPRNKKEKDIKAITGLLAEHIVYDLLRKYNADINSKNKVNVKITLDNSNNSKNQIDIKILKRWQISDNAFDEKAETIEVRSSFPYFDIKKSICGNFDVLGPYSNDIKKSEISKDYYLRVLFQLDYKENNKIKYKDKKDFERIDYNKTTINTLYKDYFTEDYLLKKDLTLYFVGGATSNMMQNPSIAYDGTMGSESFNEKEDGLFKKIKLRNAIDAISILKLILSVCTNEHMEKK